MTNQEITKYVADWFARADEDLDVAQLILGEKRPYNPACFHEQQAAEKYLKGFLAHHEKHARKIHDLDALLQECIKIDQSFESLQDSARYLSRFYVESRYPDDYVEFTREDAEKGLEAALYIKKFVLEKIVSKQKAGFGIVGIIIIIAAVAVLGGFFGYQYLKLQKRQGGVTTPAAEPPVTPSAQIPPQTAEIDTSNWKTYRNEKYGFEVRYPKEINLNESNITTKSEGDLALFTFWPSAGLTKWSYWQGQPSSSPSNHGGPATYLQIGIHRIQSDEDLSCHGRTENFVTVHNQKVTKCILPDNYFGQGDSLSIKVVQDVRAFSFYSDFYDENKQTIDLIISTFKFIK